MARFFDAQAALAEIQADPIHAIRPISANSEPKNRTNSMNSISPDLDEFEERADIIEFDAGLSRREAEDVAARAQGCGDVVEFKATLKKMEPQHGP